MGETERKVAATTFVGGVAVAILAGLVMVGRFLVNVYLTHGLYVGMGVLMSIALLIAGLSATYLITRK